MVDELENVEKCNEKFGVITRSKTGWLRNKQIGNDFPSPCLSLSLTISFPLSSPCSLPPFLSDISSLLLYKPRGSQYAHSVPSMQSCQMKKKNLCLMLLRHGWEWFMTCVKHTFSMNGKCSTDMFMIITVCMNILFFLWSVLSLHRPGEGTIQIAVAILKQMNWRWVFYFQI